MKTDFIPIDYDYFDWRGKNYAKIIGRNEKGKRICVIDSCPVYLWAILKENIKQEKIEKLISKIKKIKLDSKNRKTEVENVELHNKKFLGQNVKALKIFATNYKDLHDIADKLDFEEIEKDQLIGIDGDKEVYAKKKSFILFARNREQIGEEAFLLGEKKNSLA